MSFKGMLKSLAVPTHGPSGSFSLCSGCSRRLALGVRIKEPLPLSQDSSGLGFRASVMYMCYEMVTLLRSVSMNFTATCSNWEVVGCPLDLVSLAGIPYNPYTKPHGPDSWPSSQAPRATKQASVSKYLDKRSLPKSIIPV